MYGIHMKYTVKTLLAKGLSQRAISNELGISRKTVKKYLNEFKNGQEVITPKIERKKTLDNFHEDIKDWFSQGLTGILIQEKLLKQGVEVSYPTISRYLLQFKIPEVYVPLLSKTAEEAQVDFGYLGRFVKDGKEVKVWSFSMVLSYSRYSFHCLVTDQSVSTFIHCHLLAFEYFQGVPQTVKLDNLKAGVITPNFYEPTIQRQYAEFLQHYGSAPITARIRRGQDKGKVEAGVKYLKNNFLKRIEHNCFYSLEKDLIEWMNDTCNKRLHGTTKKIPFEVFHASEKSLLHSLPPKRYEVLNIEQRKVNHYGHISFKNNFYSVPYQYTGKSLIVKSSTSLLKIYDDTKEVAIHQINEKQGEFISHDQHRSPEKQRKNQQEYILKAIAMGTHTHDFLQKLKEQKPFQWYRIMQGIFNLEHKYTANIVDFACKRAIAYNALSYQSVHNICKNKLYENPKESLAVIKSNGFAHCLKNYDYLSNN